MRKPHSKFTLRFTRTEAILLAVIVLQFVVTLLLVHQCRMWQEKAASLAGMMEKALVIPRSPYNPPSSKDAKQ